MTVRTLAVGGMPNPLSLSRYRRVILGTSGIVFYAPLDDPVAPVKDIVGGLSGALTAGTGTSQSRVPLIPGDPGGQAVFTGSAGYYLFNGPAPIADVFTIEAWVNVLSTTANTMVIWANGGGHALLRLLNGPKLDLLNSNTADIVQSSNFAVGLRHLVATKDGATVHQYADGVDITGSVNNSTISAGGTAAIGYDGGSSTMGFPMGHVAVYARALSASEVLQHHNVGRGLS